MKLGHRMGIVLGAVVLSVIVGCGGGMKKFARNAATRDFADTASCPKNQIKTEVLSEKNKGRIYEADVRVIGCGYNEVWNCEYDPEANGNIGEWLCAPKKS